MRYVADSWPMVFDDSGAREDWGWRSEYDLEGLVGVMLQHLALKIGKTLPGLSAARTSDSAHERWRAGYDGEAGNILMA